MRSGEPTVTTAQRPDLLHSLCGDDDELKKIVVSMLESEDSPQCFEQAGATARAGGIRAAGA